MLAEDSSDSLARNVKGKIAYPQKAEKWIGNSGGIGQPRHQPTNIQPKPMSAETMSNFASISYSIK
jgi:hypothetical protein